MKILSISTDQELSEFRKLALEAAGHHVTIMLSEQDALLAVEEKLPFDMVLICHHVLSSTARKIIRLLRQHNPAVIVIYIVHLYGEWPEVEADRYVVGADGPSALVRVIAEARASA